MIFVRLAGILFTLSLLLPACQSTSSDTQTASADTLAPTQLSGQQLAGTYCASCHLLPDPALLDKKTWPNVLAQMALRMGQSDQQMAVLMRYEDPNERQRLMEANTYPDHPTMHPADWQKIVAYYTATAPEKLPLQPDHAAVSPMLPLFTAQPADGAIDGLVTLLQYDSVRHQTWAGDARGNLYALNNQLQRTDSLTFDSPVVGVHSGRNGCSIC